MPASPRSAPESRHCNPVNVLPLPAPPLRMVTRPAGTPPPSTRSNPEMPVDTFGIALVFLCPPAASVRAARRCAVITAIPVLGGSVCTREMMRLPDRLLHERGDIGFDD